jgi:nucleotide-binding universal stress UspA family protein
VSQFQLQGGTGAAKEKGHVVKLERGRKFEGAAQEHDDSPGGTVRRPTPPRPESVLLALTDGDHPTATLRQSSALARSLDADLHILRVLPVESQFVPFGPDFDVVQATRRVERCLSASRQTRVWCDDTLFEPLCAKRLRIRVGNFIEDTANRAVELNAWLIVLAPSTGRLGITATALAHAASRPVLVARTSVPHATLLAATDLEDEDSRVLRKAAELGALLGSPVVAVYNASSFSESFRRESARPSAAALASPRPSESRALRLVKATERMNSPMKAVVAQELDPVDAILEQARLHEAQAIVVGTRPGPCFDRLLTRTVAAEVVERSDRSVLVAPLMPKIAG